MRPFAEVDLRGYIPVFCLNVLFGISAVLGFQGYNSDNPIFPRPRFMPGETNFTVTRGDTAALKCGVAELGTKTVSWRRSSALAPLTIGEMTFTDDKDYEVHHSNQYWNLLIKDVQLKHEGSYECQISTSDKMKKTFHLIVLDRKNDREPDISVTGLFHIDKGQAIQLRCNATGATYPPDVIDWFKDGIKLQTNRDKLVQITKKYSYTSKTITSELIIKNSKMKDTGTYTCRTSDLQVKSVTVNILNAEKPKEKRDGGKLQSQLAESNNPSNKCSLHRLDVFVLLASTLLVMMSSRIQQICSR